jgi:hypothetical protein
MVANSCEPQDVAQHEGPTPIEPVGDRAGERTEQDRREEPAG